MPVNTRGRDRQAQIDRAVQADIDRVCAIWAGADGYPEGPWYFGDFCAADIMFAPIAARFRTYAITPTPAASHYYETLLSHPLVEEWCALGAAETDTIAIFELLEQRAARNDAGKMRSSQSPGISAHVVKPAMSLN